MKVRKSKSINAFPHEFNVFKSQINIYQLLSLKYGIISKHKNNDYKIAAEKEKLHRKIFYETISQGITIYYISIIYYIFSIQCTCIYNILFLR